jgi:tetratricopeptide (TPR) repeat protein
LRGLQGLLLLLIFVLAYIFMDSASVGSLGTCDCYGTNHCEDYPTQSEIEQAAWNSEIYYFLNYDNCDNLLNVPVRSGRAYTGATALNQTTTKNTADYWLDNANKLCLAGYYEQAAASYAKAGKLDSSLTEAWINMANSLYFLGRYQESLDAYNAVIASDPLNANEILGKGKVLMAINSTREANSIV